MSNYLITGYWGEPHVTVENGRGQNAAIWGTGRYVLPVGQKLNAEDIGSNTVRLYDGMLIDNGAIAGIPVGEYIDFYIPSASSGKRRTDLIVFQYEKNPSSLVETGSFVRVPGNESASTPYPPSLTQEDLLSNTATFDQMGLWTIEISGTRISSVRRVTGVIENLWDKASISDLVGGDLVPFLAQTANGDESGNNIKQTYATKKQVSEFISDVKDGSVAAHTAIYDMDGYEIIKNYATKKQVSDLSQGLGNGTVIPKMSTCAIYANDEKTNIGEEFRAHKNRIAALEQDVGTINNTLSNIDIARYSTQIVTYREGSLIKGGIQIFDGVPLPEGKTTEDILAMGFYVPITDSSDKIWVQCCATGENEMWTNDMVGQADFYTLQGFGIGATPTRGGGMVAMATVNICIYNAHLYVYVASCSTAGLGEANVTAKTTNQLVGKHLTWWFK